MLANLQDSAHVWDILIIGGGATGLGVAVDAASRGYSTLLLEKDDFAKSTSSRSTKLVHGGVRYLEQGDVGLVREALRERKRLLQNAPHLVRNVPFIVPNYSKFEQVYYGIGLKLYDLMALGYGFGATRLLSRQKTLELLPNIAPEKLSGGVLYRDGQFDDARLAINLAQTAADHQATLLNYAPVHGLMREQGKITGVQFKDSLNDQAYEARAKVVVNATGIFADEIRHMDNADAPAMLRISQGSHIVLDASFMPGSQALMIPKTKDGRVLFAIPWHGKLIVGTTDVPVPEALSEPRPLAQELEFILNHTQMYFQKSPQASDVRSVFSGLRPLVTRNPNQKNTSKLSRSHVIRVSESGLLTITGGKWTTYRQMAEDVVDKAIKISSLAKSPCVSKDLLLRGAKGSQKQREEPLSIYGSDAEAIEKLYLDNPELKETIHPRLLYTKGMLLWAIHHEMACTLEDFLSRRTRSLLLDAEASRQAAPQLAEFMALHLGEDKKWAESQVEAFNKLSESYVMPQNLSSA